MSPQLSKKNMEAINDALCNLVYSQNEDAAVIIEEKISAKYVQFAGGLNKGLYFNLPSDLMSGQELAKAKALISEYDVELQPIPVAVGPGMTGFSKILANDFELALTVVSRLFQEVYGFSANVNLQITEK